MEFDRDGWVGLPGSPTGQCTLCMAHATQWPRCDLVRRLQRALDVAESAIALVSATDTLVDLTAMEAPPDKIIAETAIFLRIAARVPEVAQRAHTLAKQLVPHARHPRIAVGMVLHPALALDYAVAHSMLESMGYTDATFGQLLASAQRSSVAGARERVPYRELEQHWLTSVARNSRISLHVIERTALSRGVDLLTGSRDDVYALTHAILYSTDFGAMRINLQRDNEDIVAISDSALAGALDDDDFDLAGELLLARPCLGVEWNTTSSFAFAVLARVEDEVGVLPSLSLDGVEYQRQIPEARAQYTAAASYHTAFVMGLLCACILTSNNRPEALELRDNNGDARGKQWQRNVESVAHLQSEELNAFMFDIALRQAVRTLDLGALPPILEACVASGAPATPLSAQAAALMRRLADATEFVSLPPILQS